VNAVISACTYCKKLLAKGETQLMGILPDTRIPDPNRIVKPFEYLMIDGCGPFYIIVNGMNVKRYICVFTCMILRAVHLEVLVGIDTQSFLDALTRFIARRGMPRYVRSDHGTNFTSGRREVLAWTRKLNQDNLRARMPEIQWEFSTPNTPHTQGAVERMVGLVKRTLCSALAQETSAIFDADEFHTLVVKCEGILNSRPLTFVSSHIDDLRPITPNHFLLPTAARELPPVPESRVGDKDYLPRLRMIETSTTNMWNTFVGDYLQELRNTQKWNHQEDNFQVGDIVMALEKGPRHRGRYPLARVVKVYPDAAGLVRKVRIKIRYDKPKDVHVKNIVRLFPSVDPKVINYINDKYDIDSSDAPVDAQPNDVAGGPVNAVLPPPENEHVIPDATVFSHPSAKEVATSACLCAIINARASFESAKQPPQPSEAEIDRASQIALVEELLEPEVDYCYYIGEQPEEKEVATTLPPQ
jgi:hypothetical protein